MEDWNEASEIRHLLKDVLPGHWKRRVEDEEKKRAKKPGAVRIMASEDTHAQIMEFFRRNLGEPSRMLGLKNAVYVEVFGDTTPMILAAVFSQNSKSCIFSTAISNCTQ